MVDLKELSKVSDQIRHDWKIGDDARDAGLTTPADIERFDNLQYGNDATWQILDVYRPRADKGLVLPVIINVHGGGWVYGWKETYQFYCMDLAKRGFAVVNFTYRLAPEFHFPASLEDTNLVVQWVLAHADEYGFDTKNVFFVGDSAGAHILSLYSCFCINPAYEARFDFKHPEGFAPRAIALNCGKYDIHLDEAPDNPQGAALMQLLLAEEGEEPLEKINTLNFINDQFPPAFVMSCNKDFLLDQAPLMEKALRELEVPHVMRIYGTKSNPLYHVFHCNIRSVDAELANDEECAFFVSNII